jgi:transglutaminase-like putative cysteine protease
MTSDILKYLESGPQTEITPEIQKIAQSFKKEGIDLVFEILNWLHKNLLRNQNTKTDLLRKRTVAKIIKDGFITGCGDYALVFIALARSKKIPTICVESIKKKWLMEGDEHLIEGHVFAECYINKNWYIIDPEQAAIRGWYMNYVVFKKGLDSWDIGIKNFDDLKKQFLLFKKKYKGLKDE